MNRLFIPVAPLTNETRESIYQRYIENPDVETPIKLGREFGISIIRVKAILKLKAAEKDMLQSVSLA
jgi:hypothetical protein